MRLSELIARLTKVQYEVDDDPPVYLSSRQNGRASLQLAQDVRMGDGIRVLVITSVEADFQA